MLRVWEHNVFSYHHQLHIFGSGFNKLWSLFWFFIRRPVAGELKAVRNIWLTVTVNTPLAIYVCTQMSLTTIISMDEISAIFDSRIDSNKPMKFHWIDGTLSEATSTQLVVVVFSDAGILSTVVMLLKCHMHRYPSAKSYSLPVLIMFHTEMHQWFV